MRHLDMIVQLDVERQVLAMLEQGWTWRDPYSDVLVQPDDHSLAVFYNRVEGTLRVSPELAAALELVIPSPGSKKRRILRDEQILKQAKTDSSKVATTGTVVS